MLVEGVSYDIRWKEFKRGASLFFPCLDPARARKEIGVVLDRLGIKVLSAVQIEDGIRGLRIWRL